MKVLTQHTIVLKCKNLAPDEWRGHLLHGLLFARLKTAECDLAKRLHETKGRKPFALRYSERGNRLILEVVSWDTELSAAMQSLFPEGDKVMLFSSDAVVESARAGEMFVPFDEMPMTRRFELAFMSPTCFRSSGVDKLFPDGQHTAENIARAFTIITQTNAASESVESLGKAIHPYAYSLTTRQLSFGNKSLTGFVGNCGYQVSQLDTAAEEILSIGLKALSFCGMGYKTAMGFGHVKVILIPFSH